MQNLRNPMPGDSSRKEQRVRNLLSFSTESHNSCTPFCCVPGLIGSNPALRLLFKILQRFRFGGKFLPYPAAWRWQRDKLPTWGLELDYHSQIRRTQPALPAAKVMSTAVFDAQSPVCNRLSWMHLAVKVLSETLVCPCSFSSERWGPT